MPDGANLRIARPTGDLEEVARMYREGLGFVSVASHNPYWEAQGRTLEDTDGYRVVVQNSEWP